MVGPPKALFLPTKTGHEQGVVCQRGRCVARGQLQHCGNATRIVVGARVKGGVAFARRPATGCSHRPNPSGHGDNRSPPSAGPCRPKEPWHLRHCGPRFLRQQPFPWFSCPARAPASAGVACIAKRLKESRVPCCRKSQLCHATCQPLASSISTRLARFSAFELYRTSKSQRLFSSQRPSPMPPCLEPQGLNRPRLCNPCRAMATMAVPMERT